MKRYLIFAAVGPFVGGLLLLFVTTYQSGYWEQTSAAEVGKFFLFFLKTLQYTYLFGLVPALTATPLFGLVAAGAFMLAAGSYAADKARAAEPVEPRPAAARGALA